MRLLLLAVGVWTGTLLIVWGVISFCLRRLRRPHVDDAPVSAKWLNNHGYSRDGDDRQAK